MNAHVDPTRAEQAGVDAELVTQCQQAIWAIGVHWRARKRGKRKKATRRTMIAQLNMVCGLAAATVLGAAWKSTVITAWQATGFKDGIEDRLVGSLLHEVRLLGTGGNDGKVGLAHRRAAA